MCWLTTAWFTYGVGGICGSRVAGEWMATVDCDELGGVCCPHCIELSSLDDAGRGESSTKLMSALYDALVDWSVGVLSAGLTGRKCTLGMVLVVDGANVDLYMSFCFNCWQRISISAEIAKKWSSLVDAE